MTTAPPRRRIRVDVQIEGGRVRLDLTQPTDAQLAAINGLLERWLDDDTEEPQPAASAVPPAPTPAAVPTVPEPASDARPEPVAAKPGKRPLCGLLDEASGHRCRRFPDHDGDHAWWGRGQESHHWNDAGAAVANASEPVEAAVALETVPAERPPASAVGVVLCACGHGERMHERDQLVGRGACMHGSCGCSEYRAAA